MANGGAIGGPVLLGGWGAGGVLVATGTGTSCVVTIDCALPNRWPHAKQKLDELGVSALHSGHRRTSEVDATMAASASPARQLAHEVAASSLS